MHQTLVLAGSSIPLSFMESWSKLSASCNRPYPSLSLSLSPLPLPLSLTTHSPSTLPPCLLPDPSPPVDHYMSYDDCLEDKREDYQNCSVLYCVPQLYSVICTLI